jgi:peptidoglycan/LPS O-acetylase OafA/YrhL
MLNICTPNEALDILNAGKFRKDINALRAWAVLVVVSYHFGVFGFSSGFVGVDIFFVISGYLVTNQALDQLMAGTFTCKGFWSARLRRIMPALVLVIACVVLVGWLLTKPGEYYKHIRHALAAFTFSSNFAFGGERGYFDLAAHTKPLLHSWSLSIEWQFYLLLPVCLTFVWRLRKPSSAFKATMWMFAALSAASLSWCIWLAKVDPENGFFVLQSRAWELLVGAMLAWIHHSKAPKPSLLIRKIFVVLGWILVVSSAVVGLSTQAWPSLLTLLPVFGAALIVYGDVQDIMQMVIDSGIVKCLGDWSYSLYLWHWPIVVFTQQWFYDQSGVQLWYHTAIFIFASLVLSWLSYRWVEQPFRLKKSIWTANRLWLSYLVLLVALVAFTAAAVKTRGFPFRIPDYQQRAELARHTNTPRDECFRDAKSEKMSKEQFCHIGSNDSKISPDFMLWGDSFAQQYLVPLSAAAQENGLQGLMATQSACRALLVESGKDDGTSAYCQKFNQEVLRFTQENGQIKTVILGKNWGDSIASAQETFLVVDKLLAQDKTVVLILPLLAPGVNVVDFWMRQQNLAGHRVDELRVDATPQVVMQLVRSEIIRMAQGHTLQNKIVLIDPQGAVCEREFCYLVRDGAANFRDTGHISNLNAMQYFGIFHEAFQKTKAINTAQ